MTDRGISRMDAFDTSNFFVEKFGNKLVNLDNIKKLGTYAESEWGVKEVNLLGLDWRAILETFIQMQRVFDEFPILCGCIHEISQGCSSFMGCSAKVNMTSVRIRFSTRLYRQGNINKLSEAYSHEVTEGGAPNGTRFAHAGVHELGHLAIANVIRHRSLTMVDRANDWLNHISASIVIDRAIGCVQISGFFLRDLMRLDGTLTGLSDSDLFYIYNSWTYDKKRYELIRSLSIYATMNDSEAIAEAFADWFANDGTSNPLSKSIIEIMRQIIKPIHELKEDHMPQNNILVGVGEAQEYTRRSIPRFVLEGWAKYEGGDYRTGTLPDGKTIVLGKKDGLNFIGVKEDAPEWARDEYLRWIGGLR